MIGLGILIRCDMIVTTSIIVHMLTSDCDADYGGDDDGDCDGDCVGNHNSPDDNVECNLFRFYQWIGFMFVLQVSL